MMFRKLYWVTEQVDPLGIARVSGVYTSVPELIRHGLCWSDTEWRLRLTLLKLDSAKEPFGTWCEPKFEGLEEGISTFVATEEISHEHCKMLLDALNGRKAIAA